MKVLVTGANGFMGSHLCERLLAEGHEVRGLVRRSSNLEWIEGLGLELAYGSLGDRDSLARAVAGQDWVFHTAATLRPKDLADFERVNYEGTRMLAEACIDARVRRFVFFSSAAAGGPAESSEQPRDEECEDRPVSLYGRGKLKAEQALRELRERLHSIILRFPAVYGPRDRDSVVLLAWLKRGLRPVLNGVFSVIHVEDAVGAAVLAAGSDVESGSMFYVSDGCSHTYDELTGIAARALGRRTMRVRVPRGALAAAGRLSEWLSRDGSILSRDKAKEMAQDCWVCSSARARLEFGFVPRYTLERGLTETVAWYIERKWL